MNFGPESRQVTEADGIATAIGVNADEQIYTKSMQTTYGEVFALAIKATGTTPNVKIHLQQSHVPPTTEGASDAKWVVPTGVTDPLLTLTDTNWHHIAISPIALKYMRLHLDGQAGSGADVTIEAHISRQEKWGRD
jgi:hypothetical protein